MNYKELNTQKGLLITEIQILNAKLEKIQIQIVSILNSQNGAQRIIDRVLKKDNYESV